MNETRKIFTKRMLCALLTLVISALTLASCTQEPLVIYDSETTIVIRCEETDGEKVLIDYMNELQAEGKLEFVVENGMITSINGIANDASAQSYWILYTSDADMSNAAWGTVLYKDVEYGSAVLGADALELKSGCIYIWSYMTF